MSELPPEEHSPGVPPGEAPTVRMPKWVPVAIGLVVIALAGLAVYTGFTNKVRTLGSSLTRRNARPQTTAGGGAPGEPTPGASRVLHGESGENIPQPTPMSADEGREMKIVARGDQILATMKLRARRGFVLEVTPDDTNIYVNNQVIGTAAQFRTEEQAYEFPAEGDYAVRLVAEGFQEAEYLISADPGARDEIATIRMALQKRR